MVRGRFYPETELRAKLEELAARYAREAAASDAQRGPQ